MSALTRYWKIDAAGLAACLAIASAAFFTVGRPYLQRRSERAAALRELAEQRTKLAGLEDAAAILRNHVNVLRNQAAAGELQLEPLDHLNRRVASLIELADAAGVAVHETRLGNAAEEPRYRRVPLSLSGAGSYPRCAAFLHLLHERLPDAGLVGLELSGNPGHAAAPALFKFDLTWYAGPEME